MKEGKVKVWVWSFPNSEGLYSVELTLKKPYFHKLSHCAQSFFWLQYLNRLHLSQHIQSYLLPIFQMRQAQTPLPNRRSHLTKRQTQWQCHLQDVTPAVSGHCAPWLSWHAAYEKWQGGFWHGLCVHKHPGTGGLWQYTWDSALPASSALRSLLESRNANESPDFFVFRKHKVTNNKKGREGKKVIDKNHMQIYLEESIIILDTEKIVQ